MSDALDEFREARKGHPVRCPVALLLPRLKPDDRERLIAALDAPITDIQHAAIATVVSRWGYNLASDAITRHRNGKCRCG
jgi:hypothetical protein